MPLGVKIKAPSQSSGLKEKRVRKTSHLRSRRNPQSKEEGGRIKLGS